MNIERSPEETILHALRRIGRSIDVHSRRLSREFDLTGPQLICLRELQRSGPMMPSELAMRVSLSQATVTGIVDRLSARRLVSRRRNPSDKRRVTIRITDAGHDLADNAPSPVNNTIASGLNTMPPAEIMRIQRTLDMVAGLLEPEEGEGE